MIENKRYVAIGVDWVDGFIQDHEDDDDLFSISTVINKLNEQDATIKELEKENIQLTCDNKELRCTNIGLYKANEQLKSEITMLKTTISRNEAYIERLTHKSEWHS